MFINIGNQDYKKAFTGVIFKNTFPEFSEMGIDFDDYEGSLIKVYGTINTYEGRPQIIINDPKQITRIE